MFSDLEAQLNSTCFSFFLICSYFLRIQLMMQSIADDCTALAQEWLRNRTKTWTQPKRKWAFWPLSTTCSRDERCPSENMFTILAAAILNHFPQTVSQTKSISSTQAAPSLAVLLKNCIFLWNPEELTEFLMPAFVVCHIFNTKGKGQNLLCIPLFFFLFILYRICKEDLPVEYWVELRVGKCSENGHRHARKFAICVL